jgi:hypothetical protein
MIQPYKKENTKRKVDDTARSGAPKALGLSAFFFFFSAGAFAHLLLCAYPCYARSASGEKRA